jgi:hypothetical protein
MSPSGRPLPAAPEIALPVVGLSVRQPWAWLICNAGKDIENRDWKTNFTGRVLIHAGKAMTREDYDACLIFCQGLPPYNGLPEYGRWWLPDYMALREQCGGIVGETEIVRCVTESDSPWFCGVYGLSLRGSRPLPFAPCKGALGFFRAEYPLAGTPVPGRAT